MNHRSWVWSKCNWMPYWIVPKHEWQIWEMRLGAFWLSQWQSPFPWRFRCCCVKWPLRVCKGIKTFVSVSAQQKCQTFWVLKCLKDPRLHGACRITSGVFPFFFWEKELVAPEFMVKSDAVECQMCLAWTWGHWGHWVDDPTILLAWKSLEYTLESSQWLEHFFMSSEGWNDRSLKHPATRPLSASMDHNA